MQVIEREITASQVLQVFHHSELNLFLGAAFVTVGLLVAALFCLLRRKFDALLIWLALFALLYGNRLWLQSPLLSLIVPDSEFFRRLKDSADYVVAIPAFFFFRAAGFLSRWGRAAVYPSCVLFACLAVGTFVFGSLWIFHQINNVVIIGALLWLIARSWRGGAVTKDFAVIRRGLLVCDIRQHFGISGIPNQN
jgi:phosphoserine phosphatase RsbU/P